MANIRTAMNRGAFDFVTKPVDLNDLEITVNKTLADIARVREIDRRRAAAERARLNLSRYFSPNLVELLAARDEPLGAVRRQSVAVMFVDIVGFTRMAERMMPEAVVTMLRRFHDRRTGQIFACGGTVEKYIGLIDSRHRDSLASYQIWGLGDERWEDVGAALGCGDGAGGVSGRAGGGSSCASAGDLAAAVGGGGLGGGAGDGVQPALGRQAGGAVERRGAGWAGRSAAQQWRRPGAGCGSGRSGGG